MVIFRATAFVMLVLCGLMVKTTSFAGIGWSEPGDEPDYVNFLVQQKTRLEKAAKAVIDYGTGKDDVGKANDGLVIVDQKLKREAARVRYRKVWNDMITHLHSYPEPGFEKFFPLRVGDGETYIYGDGRLLDIVRNTLYMPKQPGSLFAESMGERRDGC